MIYEWRSYDLVAGRAVEYLTLFAREGVQHVTRHLPLGGYWLAESGVLNRIHHLWIYETLAERDACRAGLAAEDGWTRDFVPRAFPLILRQRTRLMRLERGSDVLLRVTESRRQRHDPHPASAPLFAPGFMTLTLGAAPDEALAVWTIEAGGAAGDQVALSAGFAKAPPRARHHDLLRALALSPLS